MKNIVAVVSLLTLSLSISAQEYESFFEELDVVLHQVQVNVLDADGNPIRGLTKEDFAVLLDGNAQALERIEEIDLESMVNASPDPERAIPQQARRMFVFLFDLRYSTKRGVLSAQEAARDFVMSTMLPTDLAGVFTYSQLAGVTMVNNFTNDPNLLLPAIDTLGLASAKNVIPGPSGYLLNDFLDDVNSTQGFDDFGALTTSGAQGTGGTFASEHIDEMIRLARSSERANYNREVFDFLTSMRKFGDGLRFIRGRKNLVWFSTGFDANALIGEDFETIRENGEFAMRGLYERVSYDQMGRGDIQSTTRRVIESLQASGTVVFAVDTSRVEGFSTEKHGLATLNLFSVDTGGRVFSNRNDYNETLDNIKDITNHYYLVSFYPETDSGKSVAKMRVKVPKVRGAKVYTNKGLLLDPDFRNMTQIEKNIHIAEYIARDQIVRGIPLEVQTLQVPTDGPFIKLSVAAALRGDYFVVPGFKGEKREIEIFTFAFEKDSNRVFDQSHFQFNVDPNKLADILEGTGVKYFANLFVKPGNYKVKIVVRDLASGKVGSHIENINVAPGVLEVSGPVMITEDEWVVVRQPEDMERRSRIGNLDLSFPYEIGGETMVPVNTFVAEAGQQVKFFYVLNYRQSRGHRALPQVRAMFMDNEDKYILIPHEAVNAKTEIKDAEPRLVHYVITVDLDKVDLKQGETYKFLTYFGLGQNQGLRSTSELTIAGL